MTNPAYLQPIDDGLPMRSGGDYALAKLKVVEEYLKISMTAVKNTNWRSSFYIDLQAGPGKNILDGKIELGSPLIALNFPRPFTHYRFNEGNPTLAHALMTRISASPLHDRTRVLQLDVNQAVDNVCQEISVIDKPFIKGSAPSFNIAFLDPEGLELSWETVKKLASMKVMDLIINFSTSGIERSHLTAEASDRFFGNSSWRSLKPEGSDPSHKRRAWIDHYLSQLAELGYKQHLQEQVEVVVKNSKNRQLYTIIFASKHELGLKLWKEAVKTMENSRQLRLL
ncbi:MAG: three-Cys-motif partner protein TcmP [Anaerolineae bacterium]|nr:three-Cys-motif partner protein TcmP [Anaerolineae bacterium]